MRDLVKLYENISPDIQCTAAMKGLADIFGEVFGKNEESESDKEDGDK